MATRKPLICLIIVVGALGYGCYGVLNLLPAPPLAGPHFRLSPLAPPTPGAAALATAGLMQAGCALPGTAAAAAGPSVLLSLAEPAQPDGFWFSPGGAGPLLLEEAAGPTGPWQPVRYPPWVPQAAAWAYGAAGSVAVDLRAPWQWVSQYVSLVVKAALIATGCAVGLGTGRGRRGAWIAAGGFELMAAVAAVTAVAASVGGAAGGYRRGPEGAVAAWAQVVGGLIVAGGFTYEKWCGRKAPHNIRSPSCHCRDSLTFCVSHLFIVFV